MLKGEDKGQLKGLAAISTLGLSMVLTIVMGVGVGYYLDKQFGTGPILLVIFTFLGIAAGFRNIYVIVKKYVIKDDK